MLLFLNLLLLYCCVLAVLLELPGPNKDKKTRKQDNRKTGSFLLFCGQMYSRTLPNGHLSWPATFSKAAIRFGPDCTPIQDYTLEIFAMRLPLYSVLWPLLHHYTKQTDLRTTDS